MLDKKYDFDHGDNLIGGPIECTSKTNLNFNQMIISPTVNVDYYWPDANPFTIIILYFFILSMMWLELSRNIVGRKWFKHWMYD